MGRQSFGVESREYRVKWLSGWKGYYGLSNSSTGYEGDSPLWLGHLLVLLTPFCLLVIGLLRVGSS